MKNILWLFSILLLVVSAGIAQTQSVPVDIVAKLRRQAQMTYVPKQIPPMMNTPLLCFLTALSFTRIVSDQGGMFSPPSALWFCSTHPYDARREPSDADKATVKQISATTCVVTVNEFLCAMPNGKIIPGVLLANTLLAQTAAVEVLTGIARCARRSARGISRSISKGIRSKKC